MPDCIFCKIIAKEIPADIVYENDNFIVFKDIKPSAPIHWLVVPKKHTANPEDTPQEVMGEMAKIAAHLAAQHGFSQSGYRLVINVGDDGGQIIKHIHLHILAGKKIMPEDEGR